MSRQDQHRITLTIDNEDYGVWDQKSGGDASAEETKYRPGGMAASVSLGGASTVSNVTLSRLYELERDHMRIHRLVSLAGMGRCVVTVQPLDRYKIAYGKPVIYTGVLNNVKLPEYDSTSSDPAVIELEISTDSTIT